VLEPDKPVRQVLGRAIAKPKPAGLDQNYVAGGGGIFDLLYLSILAKTCLECHN
jgi:hypothetical protein